MAEHLEQVERQQNSDSLISTSMQVHLIIHNVNGDLSSLFNWNTKQVFAYLVAEYSTPKYVDLVKFMLI